MNIRNFLIGFLIFSLICNSSEFSPQIKQNNSTDFELGFKENEIRTYKILSFNENLAVEYLGFSYLTYFLGDHAYVGAYRYIRIEKIEYVNYLTSLNNGQNCSGWKIDIASWNWVTKFDWENRQGDPDIIYENIQIFENPQDLSENFYDITAMSYIQKYILDYLNIPFAFAVPIKSYINSINWAANWTVNEKMVSIRYEESNGKYVKKVHTFDEDGFLESTKVLTEDNRVIYEYALENKSISIFILVFMFILAGVTISAIIYIYMKKIKI